MIFKNFFKKSRSIQHPNLGELVFVDDGVGTYWEIIKYSDFALAAITGSDAGPTSRATSAFLDLIGNTDKLFTLINSEFLEIIKPEHEICEVSEVKQLFRLHSLTVESAEHYEVGFHSNSQDIFVELFVRDGTVKEIYKDVGCCET